MNAYKFWSDQLLGKKPEWPDTSHPEAGYFRNRYHDKGDDRGKRVAKYEAVGFWQDEAGKWCCARSKFGDGSKMKLDEMAELFASCCRDAVTYEVYETFLKEGVWPADVGEQPEPEQEAPAEGQAPEPEKPAHERAKAAIAKLKKEATDWLLKLGHKPATQEEADKAANYADKFAKIAKAAEDTRKALKEPHLEAGRLVDSTWNPIVKEADAEKAWSKALNVDFIKAENDRRIKEAAEENARRQAEYEAARKEAEEKNAQAAKLAEVLGEDAAPPVAEVKAPVEVKAEAAKVGTGARRQSLVETEVYEITDIRTLLTFLAERNTHTQALLDAARAEAEALAKNGHEVPGLTKRIKEGVR